MNLDYDAPFNFTGKLGKLFIELKRSTELSRQCRRRARRRFAMRSPGVGRAGRPPY
jgi:hypothetical protein